MKQILVLLAVVAACYGVQYDELRVRFGMDSSLIPTDYFMVIPKTVFAAIVAGWRSTERPPGLLPSLTLYCPPERTVCALYAPQGFVAGLQVALPIDETITPYDLDGPLVRWNAPAFQTEPARAYLTASQYFITEESLTSESYNGESLIHGPGIWTQDSGGYPWLISTEESRIIRAGYTEQTCIPAMGAHFYNSMTPELPCDHFAPWFALTENGKLVGTGFQVFGYSPVPQNQKDWLERPSGLEAVFTVPHAPPCLLEMTNAYGAPTLHIYYVSNPWTITCP